ncbi:GNAT family N-acetyltransferase [Streptomyces sp. NPDC102441]|uniref:GNAT family N-acetyltransferase n=1 Tax=Streptomyces sp. NPDC102441 TaxID=3366176 RepID=UPI00381B74EF
MSDISTRWYRPGTIPTDRLGELTDMFAEVADEFVPPLTSRGGTAVSDLRDPEAAAPANGYLDEMLQQDLIMSWHEDQIAGFVSFRSNHHDPRFAELCPCLYVSTIAVRPRHRRHGIARALYQELFDLPASLPPWIVLRTWSTNAGHLELLGRLGFATILHIEDDRADGVDTLYLAADRTSKVPLRRTSGS